MSSISFSGVLIIAVVAVIVSWRSPRAAAAGPRRGPPSQHS